MDGNCCCVLHDHLAVFVWKVLPRSLYFLKKPKSKVKKNKDGLYINDENKNKKVL